MRPSSPVAILLFALSSSRLGAQDLSERELAYKGCYALTALPPVQRAALGLPPQIEFTVEPKRDAEGRLWNGGTRPSWRSVRINQPARPDVYGGWAWRLVRDGHIEMAWVANGPSFGTVNITLEGRPKVLVGTAQYTSDDFSTSPAVPIRAERISCATRRPK
jgi:hypothetical protein